MRNGTAREGQQNMQSQHAGGDPDITVVAAPIPGEVWKDVRIYDCKDGVCRINVAYRDVDPSRLWLAFENHAALIQISLEEGGARHLFQELCNVLSRFPELRASIDQRRSSR